MWFLFIIIGLVFGAGLVYLIQKPKMKTFIELDIKTAQKNQKLEKKKQELEDQLANLKISYADIQSRHDEYLTNLGRLEAWGKEACEKLYQQNLELANTNFEQQAENLANQFQQYQKEVENEYLTTIQEFQSQLSSKIQQGKDELKLLEDTIADKRSLMDAMVASYVRMEEIEQENNFYKIILSQEDINEIMRLKDVSLCLRDKEPLNKIVWKVYYEKPTTDLINRVIGTGIHAGIYKITNTANNMCYVGQSVNIAERWRQHIKRGLGAETPTRNKLYPAMQSFGVENFTFEIIEECEREQLDTREDYWQEYFHAKDFGYSIK